MRAGVNGFSPVMRALPSRLRHHDVLALGVEAYLDGEADPLLARAARRHLATCWECSERAEWTLLIKAALGRIGRRRPVDLASARCERFAWMLAGGRGAGSTRPG